MTRDKKLEMFETLCTISWFLLDGSWMLQWPIAVGVLICPAIFFNFMTFFYIERHSGSVLAVMAVNSWLLMNIFWAVADIYHMSISMAYAKLMFWSGLGFLLTGLAIHRDYKQYVFLVFYRFRRLRISKNGIKDKVQ